MLLTLRYDMRAPAIGASAPALYGAAVEQCVWADRLGFDRVHIAEHHGAEDGYCPAPMVLASAIAARTKQLRLQLSALVAVLHHPIRLAEELAVLDILSNGRLGVTLGIGYRQYEYDIFGVDKKRRVQILEETIEILQKAWTGEPFEFRGQSVVVRPTPVQQPRIPLFIGGSTEASARRAARAGDGYVPAGVDAELFAVYEAECARLGRVPGPRNPVRGPMFLHITEDPERDWPIVAPHVIYTSNSNAEWAKERGVGVTPYTPVSTVDDLKANSQFAVVTPEGCIELARALGADSELTFQPLMGGLDPEVAQASLDLFESAVLPRLVEEQLR